MKEKSLKVLGAVLSFVLLIVPGIYLIIAAMNALFDTSWGSGRIGLGLFTLFLGVPAVFFGGMIIYSIITKSIKYRVNKFLKKRGKRYDRIFIESYAYDKIQNPMADEYKKIVEGKIRSYLPEALRAEQRNRASLYVDCHWDTFFYSSMGTIECDIRVYDNLNKSKNEKPLFSYTYSFSKEKSQFVEDNLLLSTMTFVERPDFIKLIKSIPVKLKYDGLELLIKKDPSTKIQHNMGTCFRDEEHAHDHWASQYVLNGPPVIICTFDTLGQAKEAMLTISFISEKNGKLISSETVDYGCYLTSQKKGEVIICGHEFSKRMYDEAKLILSNSGGRIKQATKPEEPETPKAVISKPKAPATEVTFVNKSKRQLAPGVTATYETYKATSEAAAKKFLASKNVTQPLHYIVVDAPEGSWGKDKDGMYKE